MDEKKKTEYLSTPLNDIPKIVTQLHENFETSCPTPIDYRIKQLKQLLKLIDENEKELINACREYFYGNYDRQVLTRLFLIRYDIGDAIVNIKKWTKNINYPQAFPNNIMWKAKGSYHPLGVVCIIAPWNYPIQLLLRPLIGAIAAGNAVVLKPSEVTDKVARLLYELIPKYLDNNMIKVICGGPDETNLLLSQKLNYVLFTGSTNIGKIIMKKCSENLIPCCLELGGKNPVILDDSTLKGEDLVNAIKRIVYSRFENAGQVCLCPEYIFCSRKNQDKIITIIRETIKTFFNDCKNCDDYCHIVDSNHFGRLKKLRDHYINDHPGQVAIGLKTNELDNFIDLQEDSKTRYLPPLVLKNITFPDKIMENEVFGPILSIVPMDGEFYQWKQNAYNLIRLKSKPLACYVFTKSKYLINEVNNKIQAGAIVANMCIMHMSLKNVPFGGIGESGMNHYGGKETFKLFSQLKPLNIRSYGLEFFNKDQYPGPTQNLKALNKQISKLIPKEQTNFQLFVQNTVIIGAVAAVGWYIKQKYFHK